MAQKKKRRRRATRGERFVRSVLTLLLTFGTLWGLWNILIPKPAVVNDVPVATTEVDTDDGISVFAAMQKEDKTYQRKKDCWTFLLVGMDKGGGNTDSLMLVTYDVENQSVSVGSIARDTRVNVTRKLKKINAAYAFGKIDGLMREVSQTFGVPVDYYLRVKINGFVRLVDAVGGVDFAVPCAMDYDDPYQELSIHYQKGTQHLNGQQALEVCRFRQNNDGSGYGDSGRQETQRGVLTQVMKKMLTHPSKLSEYAEIAADTLDTNLSVSDMIWFASKALSLDAENLHTMSMPCQWKSPYMYLDPDATREMINAFFNPYELPRTAEQLDIVAKP